MIRARIRVGFYMFTLLPEEEALEFGVTFRHFCGSAWTGVINRSNFVRKQSRTPEQQSFVLSRTWRLKTTPCLIHRKFKDSSPMFGILRKKEWGRHNPHSSTKKHHATKPLVHHGDEIGEWCSLTGNERKHLCGITRNGNYRDGCLKLVINPGIAHYTGYEVEQTWICHC